LHELEIIKIYIIIQIIIKHQDSLQPIDDFFDTLMIL